EHENPGRFAGRRIAVVALAEQPTNTSGELAVSVCEELPGVVHRARVERRALRTLDGPSREPAAHARLALFVDQHLRAAAHPIGLGPVRVLRALERELLFAFLPPLVGVLARVEDQLAKRVVDQRGCRRRAIAALVAVF